MFCSNCGARMDSDSKFCTSCGMAVKYEQIVYKKHNFKRKIVFSIILFSAVIILILLSISWTKKHHETKEAYRSTGRREVTSTESNNRPIYKQYNDESNEVEKQRDSDTANIEDRYRLEDLLYITYDESELYMFGDLLSSTEDSFLGGYTYEFEHGSVGVDANRQIVSIVADADIKGVATVLNVFINMNIDDIFLNLGEDYETEEVDEYGNTVYGYYSDDGTFFVKFYIDEEGQTTRVMLFDPYS